MQSDDPYVPPSSDLLTDESSSNEVLAVRRASRHARFVGAFFLVEAVYRLFLFGRGLAGIALVANTLMLAGVTAAAVQLLRLRRSGRTIATVMLVLTGLGLPARVLAGDPNAIVLAGVLVWMISLLRTHPADRVFAAEPRTPAQPLAPSSMAIALLNDAVLIGAILWALATAARVLAA